MGAGAGRLRHQPICYSHPKNQESNPKNLEMDPLSEGGAEPAGNAGVDAGASAGEQEVAADRAAKKQSKAKQSKAKPRKQVNEGLAWALHESAVYAESAALATTVDECLVERALADSRADAEEGAAMKLQGAVRRWQARNVAVMEVRWQQARRQGCASLNAYVRRRRLHGSYRR